MHALHCQLLAHLGWDEALLPLVDEALLPLVRDPVDVCWLCVFSCLV